MPSWIGAGDPTYAAWMTHTPQGSVNDDATGAGAEAHESYSYCGDAIQMYTHCGTHIDTLNHVGHHGRFWNGWTPDRDLGSRVWNKGGAENYPPVISRGVLLDVAGMHGVEQLEPGYAITPKDLQDTVGRQGVELRKGDVVLFRTGRMQSWPDVEEYLRDSAGINLDSAKWLCEEAGAMCIGGDNITCEVMPPDVPGLLPPGPRLHVLDRGLADHGGRQHGGDRGGEAVRVRVPRLPAEAARRDGRADADVRRPAEGLARAGHRVPPYTGRSTAPPWSSGHDAALSRRKSRVRIPLGVLQSDAGLAHARGR